MSREAFATKKTGDEELDVVVIGAGPVGLATALQFGRLGVATRVFERRADLSRHPKAGGVHARTLEIFRRWGLADDIRAVGHGSGPTGFGWVTRLNGLELGLVEFGTAEDRARWALYSPEGPAFCGQDLYEPILHRGAIRHPSVRVEFGKRAQIVGQDADGVSIAIVDEASGGVVETIRARYVVAADGVRSPSRQALGVGETGYGTFGDSIDVLFRADLEKHRAGRDYVLFWTANPDTQGAFWWRRGNNWSYNFEATPGEDSASYTRDRSLDIVRKAIGDESADIEIVSILHWKHDQAVTRDWRVGRVFFAGDSAHRFPPHGGFGMNSGVQDSANLVWKITLALRGLAGDALLDSYQDERKPVAEFNGEQSLENTRRMAETGWLLSDPGVLANIEKSNPEGEALRAKIAEAVPRQREQFFSFGQQFGTIYRSSAVIPDGSEPELSTVSDYCITAHPGARAPHLWLRAADGRELSTIDLFYDGFVVLAGSAGRAWREAAERVGADLGLTIVGYTVGPDGDFAERAGERFLTEAYGIDADGAVLVRPDGHVAFRSRTKVADATRTLSETLDRLLSRPARAEASSRDIDSLLQTNG
jgi:putative polyketide hydroxylase